MFSKDSGSGGFPSIRLICRDGSSQVPLFFKNTTTAEFLDRLQGYITLRRSHRDSHLVIVVDQKSEALAKSVSMLDENGDILSVICPELLTENCQFFCCRDSCKIPI